LTMKNDNSPTLPLSVPTGNPARLWLSYWPQQQPAIHTLKLTSVLVHPFGLRFETGSPFPLGTQLHIRLLLPPMTAIALQGVISDLEEAPLGDSLSIVSIRFTTIRETDRQRLTDFCHHRVPLRLRAHSIPQFSPKAVPSVQ